MGFASGAGAVPDLVSGLAGLFQTTVLVSVFKREVHKLRPRIDMGMSKNKGVLLVLRTETSGFEASVKRILGLHFVGAGMHPAGLMSQWRQQGQLWPAPAQGLLGRTSTQEEFLWVCRSKDFAAVIRQPVMTSGSGAQDYKYIPYEQLY